MHVAPGHLSGGRCVCCRAGGEQRGEHQDVPLRCGGVDGRVSAPRRGLPVRQSNTWSGDAASHAPPQTHAHSRL